MDTTDQSAMVMVSITCCHSVNGVLLTTGYHTDGRTVCASTGKSDSIASVMLLTIVVLHNAERFESRTSCDRCF